MTFTENRKTLALQMFDCGAINIDTAQGYQLRMHDKDPGVQRSPIKFNIRAPKSGKGNVNDNVMNLVGAELAYLMQGAKKFPDVLVGVPNAGDGILDAVIRNLPIYRKKLDIGRIYLSKDDSTHNPRIKGIEGFEGTFTRENVNAWLVDDVGTRGDSKVNCLDFVSALGFKVSTCLVVVDREQGMSSALREFGITVKSIFTARTLLDFYLREGRVTEEQHRIVMEYFDEQSSKQAA